MIDLFLQQATSTDVGKIDATFTAALIAAAAATLGTIATVVLAWMQRSAHVSDARRALILKQLNELYGPLFMLRTTSAQLRDRVGPNDGTWRLVDHIVEVKRDPTKAAIVQEILTINERISELIEGQAGLLVEFPPPRSFEEFLPHARLLKMRWERGANQDAEDRFPFPRALDDDIASSIRKLKAGLTRASVRS